MLLCHRSCLPRWLDRWKVPHAAMPLFLHIGQPWHCLVWFIFPVFESTKFFVRRIFAWYWLKPFIHTFRKTGSAYFAHEVCFFPFIQQLSLLPAHDTILTSLKQRRENIGSLSKRALSNSVPELSATQHFWTWSSFLSQMRAEKTFLGKKTTQMNTHGFGNSSSWSSQCWTLLETKRCYSFHWGLNFVRGFH